MSAGAVGPIGDPNLNVRLRRTTSDMPLKFDSNIDRGTTINDGNNPLMYRVGPGAGVFSDEMYPRVKKVQHVVRISEPIPSEERVFTSKQVADPKQAWHDSRNSVLRDTGAQYGRLPRGFVPSTNQQRRGQTPFLTRIEPT